MNIDEQIHAGQIASGAGVPHGELLVSFVNATAAGGDELAAARDQVVDVFGHDGLVDVAAVVANFHMMTRVADGTGTPLDDGSAEITVDLRNELGVESFVSRRLTEQ